MNIFSVSFFVIYSMKPANTIYESEKDWYTISWKNGCCRAAI